MPGFFTALGKIFRPIYDWTDKIIMNVCKLLLVADVAITTMSVAGRYISFIPDPAWSEQMVLTLMVYMAVLSATLAIRKRAHIRMTAFDDYLPPKLVKYLDLLSDFAVLALGVIMLIYGIKVCQSPLAKFGRYESLPQLSRVWMYLPIPVAGAGMIIFELEQIFLRFEELFSLNEVKE
ncbi:MAG: TRAP transporter small permease [Synergistaceae bacterium]|nr:TRAP transporter small permease [Synergistaceae bacterium]MBQ9595677.1 TRAP transporter small permease [Synergistaceae bacterium]MBR0205042.1 TRAP transporter small permease [Synergistaceae bacterium]